MNNLEPVNSRKDYLTPRAKIGDVVEMKNYWWIAPDCRRYQISEVVKPDESYNDYRYYTYDMRGNEGIELRNEDILKNLTTNVSYEANT